MSVERTDAVYRQMARTFAEEYGAELLEEMKELRKSGPDYLTPNLDRRVKRETGQSRRQYRSIGVAVAACLALLLLVPQLIPLWQDSTAPQEAPDAGGMLQSAEFAEMELADDMDVAEEEAVPEMTDYSALYRGEVIPLGFALPEALSVESVELDNGRSIYHLENQELDDIVLTLEYLDEPFVVEDLTPLVINGQEAFVRTTPDYNLLTFEREGLQYTLTCRHDINTLVGLSRHIL